MIRTIHSGVARFVTMALVLAALLPAAGTSQARAPAGTEGAGLAPVPSRAEMSSAATQDLDFGRLPLYFV